MSRPAFLIDALQPSVGSFLLTSELNVADIVTQQQRCKVNTLQIVDRPKAMPDNTIKEERPCVEELLARYRAVIGSDYDGYRNHLYRAITYAMHFLNNATEHEQLVETAFVYHDIGLWTDHVLAYLEPSSKPPALVAACDSLLPK